MDRHCREPYRGPDGLSVRDFGEAGRPGVPHPGGLVRRFPVLCNGSGAIGPRLYDISPVRDLTLKPAH